GTGGQLAGRAGGGRDRSQPARALHAHARLCRPPPRARAEGRGRHAGRGRRARAIRDVGGERAHRVRIARRRPPPGAGAGDRAAGGGNRRAVRGHGRGRRQAGRRRADHEGRGRLHGGRAVVRGRGAERDGGAAGARQGRGLVGGARPERAVAARRAPRRHPGWGVLPEPPAHDRLAAARAGGRGEVGLPRPRFEPSNLRAAPGSSPQKERAEPLAGPRGSAILESMKISYHVMSAPAPLGLIFLAATDRGLRYTEFMDRRSIKRILASHAADNPGATWEASLLRLKGVVDQFESYFCGALTRFEVPLDPLGSEFQLQAWKALLAIPYGETRTYGEIARAIGQPRAARAVGLANHDNPIVIIVPCHRVVGSDGSLTGYGGALQRQGLLL